MSKPGRKLTRDLYRAARLSNDLSTLASGDSTRIARRLKNKLVGRLFGHWGIWRWLWSNPSRRR